MSDADYNGLELSTGVIVPEPVVEIILSKVPTEYFLNIRQVCSLWNEITKRLSFWKLHCEHNRKQLWSIYPEHLKHGEHSWIIMYMENMRGLLSRNFVKNHSGYFGFDHWRMIRNGGHQMRIESPPIGCDPLPEDSEFSDASNICFVTSYGWSVKVQEIDLWEYGLTPIVLQQLLPFRLEISQRYTSRFDCGGLYKLSVRLRNENRESIRYKKIMDDYPATTEWKSTVLNFHFSQKNTEENPQVLRFLSFKDGGRDTQDWAGHYGTKLAHSRVRLITLETSHEISDDDDSDDDGGDDESEDEVFDYYQQRQLVQYDNLMGRGPINVNRRDQVNERSRCRIA